MSSGTNALTPAGSIKGPCRGNDQDTDVEHQQPGHALVDRPLEPVSGLLRHPADEDKQQNDVERVEARQTEHGAGQYPDAPETRSAAAQNTGL